MAVPSSIQLPGTLIISLDFELVWGVRDQYGPDGGAYRDNLLGARAAVPRMLDLFAEYDVAATWATVGMLMARSRSELDRFRPATPPSYANACLSPYGDPVGDDESADPIHYAASLVDLINSRRGQEIGSHTYGHYYPLEPGADAESFRADLDSAVAIAAEQGIQLRSLVFPRNQFNAAMAGVISAAGFTSCRSNPASWMYAANDSANYFRPSVRAGRLLDNYLPVSGSQVIRWHEIPFEGDLCCLPASHFLRPYTPRLSALDGARFRRISKGIVEAARTNGVYHLWWHPHNAGLHTDEFLDFLRRLLEVFANCRDLYGMTSMTMTEAADTISRAHALAS